jgi:hypothetical protein
MSSPAESGKDFPSTTAVAVPVWTCSSALSLGISAHAVMAPNTLPPVMNSASSSTRTSNQRSFFSNRRSAVGSRSGGGGPGGTASGG